ncbi:FAD-binding domain-containing protein [Hypoxylon trugodes]|uniref:FAD-binding domain-containing protein n=1 Tax=Hypoxylon trugodes TaxID=326681 RepID=UPI00219BD588|nr:FAD-binding domain-containing protein [Hypoxylon trugodes]KAI1392118.1 FAD-binding domain-containing protein [Hypoxylon trugodes]
MNPRESPADTWFSLRSFLILASVFVCGDAFSKPSRRDNGPGTCKTDPSSAEWPSDDEWAKLNETTGGQLLKAVAPGSVCHPEQPDYNPDQCATVTTGWTTYDFHQNDPISNMWEQYNNDTCLPDPNTPCSPDGYPAYVVNATSADIVKLGIDFARTHNIRVVIKSTGHDYQGRSQAPGALSIWVRHLQSIEAHTGFQPQGCDFMIDGPAVTVGGGSQLIDIYRELDKINQTVVGGNGASVSVGGYVTGGGHSILAPRYGLAADQVLEVEVVTPSGDIVVANECQNQDLFWATRGGGGSTFGVMTSVTMTTHPSPQVVGLAIGLLASDLNAPYVWDMVAYLLSQFPYLDSKGVSGYSYLTGNFTYPGAPFSGAGMGAAFVIQDTQNTDDMVSIWAPILDHVNKTWPDVTQTFIPQAYPSFYAWFEENYDKLSAGSDIWVGSHLLSADALTSNQTAVAEAFKIFDGTAYLVAGEGVKNAKPRGGSNAVNPSWRNTLVHTTTAVVFSPLNHTAKEEALVQVNAITEPLRQLDPGMGAYVNENNPGEPDWQHSFWGENYERLLQIKRTIDPDDVLWCNPCVGNDRWKENGYQLCRVDSTEG